MKLYFAPMEGITGYIYRNAHHTFFHSVDKYFTPFILPNQKGHFNAREKQDMDPRHNEGICVVPQILTNCAEDFVKTAKKLADMGYQELNLNLGCPSRTVVTKYRGSGFLALPEKLDLFLDSIFSEVGMAVSIKTRIGRDDPGEFERLMEIFNQYPVRELIIHPRTQQDYYRNKPNLEKYGLGLQMCKNPVCYNGDICTPQDYQNLVREFPGTTAVMMGRGLLKNPGLAEQISGESGLDKERLRAFHDRLYEDYQRVMPGAKNVLFKMKEVWVYMASLFHNWEKYGKRIRKAERLPAYEKAVNDLFAEQELNIPK